VSAAATVVLSAAALAADAPADKTKPATTAGAQFAQAARFDLRFIQYYLFNQDECNLQFIPCLASQYG
jgi:hypothetical protein